MTRDVAYPGRHTPPSYVGPEEPAHCPHCGAVRYVPAPDTFDNVGSCGRCGETVQWVLWSEVEP